MGASNKRLVAFTVVVVAAVLLIYHIQTQSAQTLYENQIASCESGNVVRFVLHDFADSAVEARQNEVDSTTGERRRHNQEAVDAYGKDAQMLVEIPYGRPDGTRNCVEAIDHP